jgi:hypothetical protein
VLGSSHAGNGASAERTRKWQRVQSRSPKRLRVAGTEEKAARERKAAFVYFAEDGSETKSLADAVRLRVDVVGAGSVEFDRGRIEGADYIPSGSLANAMLMFAAKQKASNATGGRDATERFEIIEGIFENLHSGVWSERAAGAGEGGNVSMLAQAMLAAYAEQGKDLTIEQVRAAIKAKDDEWRKNATRDPRVKKHLDRLRAEAAAKRAEESAKKGGSADGDLPDLGLGE